MTEPASSSFFPAAARPGRLLRLSVVIDRRNTPARIAQLALFCEHAGIDAVWLSRRPNTTDNEEAVDVGAAIALAGQATKTAFVGGTFSSASLATLPATLTRMAANLGRRLEFGLSGVRGEDELSRIIGECGRGLAILTAGADTQQRLLPPLSLDLIGGEDLALCARWADNAVMYHSTADIAGIERWRERLAEACDRIGRDPSGLGLALEVPVSIGRTQSEAHARAEAEPLFAEIGSPAEVGIYGRLEECQDTVIALAHAGVTELRCRLPNSPDAHDVIAQVTGMVVGRLDVLRPGAERSKAPDPPDWAGGLRH